MLNEKQLEFCNILKWNEAGITGKGVKIAVYETDVNPSLFNGKVSDPFEIGSAEIHSHGNQFVHVLLQVAPDAELILMPHSYPAHPSVVDGWQYCIDNKIKLYTKASFLQPCTEEKSKQTEYYLRGGLMICAAGNEKKDLESFTTRGLDGWFTVAASYLEEDNSITRASYSNYGDELDISVFTRLEVELGGETYTVNGTSFACPFFTGMLALLLQVYPDFKNTDILDYVLENSIDIGAKGFDIYTGNGLFVLPKEIPEVDDMKIILTIDSKEAFIDGVEETLSVAPFIKNNTTFVPLRFVSEKLGAKVEWNQQNKQITISK